MGNRTLGIMLLLLLAACPTWAAEGSGVPAADEAKATTVQPATPESLWQEATTAAGEGKWSEASALYQRLHKEFPKAAKAEDALWQAAQLARKAAGEAKDPDWGQVRDLFRLYAADYPKSARYPEAYFELGVAHYHMRFFREAATYFKLFQKRYPQSPLAASARSWQGRTLMEVGRLDEAIAVFQQVAQGEDEQQRTVALAGIGKAYVAKKDYARAIESFEGLLARTPRAALEDPELLLSLGMAYLKVGREAEGQRRLFHFVNLLPQSPRRFEVLFELGESFHRQGDDATAQKLYARVVEDGEPGSRPVLLSQFRQSEYLDDPRRKLSSWQRRRDLNDPEGDALYQRVLEGYRHEPIAQDARYLLFLRYRARGNHDLAAEMGRSFLRHDPPGPNPGEKGDVGAEVMAALVEELLGRGAYQEIQKFYRAEAGHVEKSGEGRLRYLVGQALQAMDRNEQAAALYYRALAFPLADADKLDLYVRRAHVYLALKDFASAERLLEHLRKSYAGTGGLGEILYYSGRLREEQKRYDEALAFYDQALPELSQPEKKQLCGEGRLRMLLHGKRFSEMLVSLDSYRKEGWLSAVSLQGWYRKVGDMLRRESRTEETIKAYLGAVGENMPQEGGVAQGVHLHLGDLLVQLGEFERGRDHFRKAQTGADPFLKKLAEERLNQLEIDRSLSVLQPLLRQK
ncbi:MAG: tetratricopeptide repeat protein [Thermodesulfobacteriota bacterium]